MDVIFSGQQVEFGRDFAISAAEVGIPQGLPGATAHIVRTDVNTAEVTAAETRILVRVAGAAGALEAFLNANFDWFPDILMSKAVCGDNAALITVRSADRGFVWISSVRPTATRWNCTAVRAKRPKELDTEYALSPEPAEQAASLKRAHRDFRSLLGAAFWGKVSNGPGLLRVKVAPSERWFIRFPLGAFARDKMDGFEDTALCHWIVTSRSFCETALAQRSVETAMTEMDAFLNGALFVLNTYSSFSKASDTDVVLASLALVEEVLGYFGEIYVDGRRLQLHWTRNPSPECLRKMLEEPRTRFVFGLFEGEAGTLENPAWEMGDLEHACQTPCSHACALDGDRKLNLRTLKDKLKHIDLLSCVHCRSLVDEGPGREPVDAGTVAAMLIDSGARFVDASPNLESPVVFAGLALKALLGREDLQLLLYLEDSINLPLLFERANRVMDWAGLIPLELHHR